MHEASNQSEKEPTPPRAAWVPYVIPMALFMALTWLEGRFPAQYVSLYLVKIALVTVVLIACCRKWIPEIRPSAGMVAIGVIVGLAVLAVWIGIEQFIAYPHVGTRAAFNPFEQISDSVARNAFIATRLFGLALVVPIVEEVFWRSFLQRYFTRPDWWNVTADAVTVPAILIVSAAFGVVHPEWLAGIVAGLCYGFLYRQARSLFASIVAHATTNLALGIYVLQTGEWKLW